MADWDDMAVVGWIARPHGLKGDVIVTPETDFVDERFKPGAVLWTRSARGDEQLTIAALRMQNGRPVVSFEGRGRIEDVEAMSGQELRVPEAALQPLGPGQYYEHQLVGCAVERVSGEPVGVVTRIEGGLGGSRLVIDGERGEIQIPMTGGFCVDIDVTARRIRVDPPEGLLELNEVRRRDDLSADGGSGPRRRGRQPRN